MKGSSRHYYGPGRRMVYRGRPFSPDDLSTANGGPLSAWLRVVNATLVSGDVSSLPDSLNVNPAVQSVAGRRPTAENSAGNALPCMRFAANDVLSWPLNASNNGVSNTGFGLWMKPDSIATADQRLVTIQSGTGGASDNHLTLRLLTSTLSGMAFITTANGRNATGTSPALTTGWQFVTVEYEAAAATESLRLTLTVNGTVSTRAFSNIGAGGTLGSLPAVTGNILFGNTQDSAAPLNPFSGLIGPNIYALSSKMTGATGLLAASARAALMNFEAPT
jgi:hypothetical protein